jgi:hypothetical protein
MRYVYYLKEKKMFYTQDKIFKKMSMCFKPKGCSTIVMYKDSYKWKKLDSHNIV